jgi:hypothetical protein
MKKIQNILTVMTLAAIVLLSSTFANAGIIVAGYNDTTTTTDPCSTTSTDISTDVSKDTKIDSGIIVAGFTGIIVAGFTGIIVAGATGIIVTDAKTTSTTNCGIIVAG